MNALRIHVIFELLFRDIRVKSSDLGASRKILIFTGWKHFVNNI